MQELLYPVDYDPEELPDIGMDGREVRYWLRDNMPGEPLPADFNVLVSYATNTTLRPYINHAGTWPSIVENWAGWGWSNGFKEAAVRLVHGALFNTNATADQSVWLDMFCNSTAERREVMQESFKQVLPSALHSLLNPNALFAKNIDCVMKGANFWCTPDCIESMTDDQVLAIVQNPCRPPELFKKIFSLWLNHPEHGGNRLTQWQSLYLCQLDTPKGNTMVGNLAETARLLTEDMRHNAFRAVKAGNMDKLMLLQYALTDHKQAGCKLTTSDWVVLLEGIAEEPFEIEWDAAKCKTLLQPLREHVVWSALNADAQRRLAVLVAYWLAPSNDSWAEWYNDICESLHLPMELFSLVNALELNSWPELVRYHETKIGDISLPDFNLDSVSL